MCLIRRACKTLLNTGHDALVSLNPSFVSLSPSLGKLPRVAVSTRTRGCHVMRRSSGAAELGLKECALQLERQVPATSLGRIAANASRQPLLVVAQLGVVAQRGSQVGQGLLTCSIATAKIGIGVHGIPGQSMHCIRCNI